MIRLQTSPYLGDYSLLHSCAVELLGYYYTILETRILST